MKNRIMNYVKIIPLLVVAFSVRIGLGIDDDPTTSNYNEAKQEWYVGDVVALTNALTNVKENDTVILSEGEYDLSFLAESPMVTSENSYGKTLIWTRKKNVKICGKTGNPKDVVLDGKGVNARIIYITGEKSGVMNVTIRGGRIVAASGGKQTYRCGGGAFFVSENTFISNCIITACYSDRGGGAVSAPHNGRRGRVLDCVLFNNSTDCNGGGAIAHCELVSGCTVVSNIQLQSGSAHGGGAMYSVSVVTNCTVAYNYATGVGGGLFNCDNVYKTDIEHNISDRTIGSDNCGSGGAYGGKFYSCTFRDNCAASVCNAILMEKCIVEDGRVNCLTNINCKFQNLHNSPDYVWAKGNVQYPDGKSTQSLYGFYGVELMRNCLITGCEWGYGSGDDVDISLFNNVIGRIENCTIADNTYHYFGSNFKSGAVFVNCAIVRNTLGDSVTPSDVSLYKSTLFCFSNCVWNVTGARGDTVVRNDGYRDSGCLELGAGVSPMFFGKGEHPYTPKCFSALRTSGKLLDWMTDGIDLAGNPRLRDGMVDIGCYQCWLDPIGLVFSVR